MNTAPDPRTIRRALGVLDRWDEAGPDPDLEPEEDCCTAGEDGGLHLRGDGRPGDASDAEQDDDDQRRS